MTEWKDRPCKRFEGAHNKGYGVKWRDGRVWGMHQLAWIDAHGPVPDGYEIDHLCRVKDCYEITHLEAVPHRENMRRSPIVGRARGEQLKSRTHCPSGHEYSPENTYVYSERGSVERACKECRRAANRRWNQRKREKK